MPRNLIPPQFRSASNESIFKRRLRSLTLANILLLGGLVALILFAATFYLSTKPRLLGTLTHVAELQRSLVKLEGALDQLLVNQNQESWDNALWYYEGFTRSLQGYQKQESWSQAQNLQHLSLALTKLERDFYQLLQTQNPKQKSASEVPVVKSPVNAEIQELKRFVGECMSEAQKYSATYQREQSRMWWLLSIPLALGIGYGGWAWGRRQMRFIGKAFHETVDLVNFQVAQQKLLFASISDAVLVMNQEQEVTYYNPEAERLLGVKLSKGRGKIFRELLGDANSPSHTGLLESVDRVFKEAKPRFLPKSAAIMSGQSLRYHVEGTASPIFDEDNNFGGVILVFRDCSDVREKELSLMARERLYRSVFNQQYQYLTILDASGRVMEMNEPFVRINDGDAKQHADTKFWDLPCWKQDPKFINLWQSRLRQASDQLEPLYCEDEYCIDGKEKRFFEGYIARLMDDSGKDKGYLIQAQDVTERKLVDAKIQSSALKAKFLGQISDSIRFLSDPMEVVRSITGHLTEFLHVSHCAYLEVDSTQTRGQVLYDFFVGEKRPLSGSYAISDFGEVAEASLKQGHPLIIEDVRQSLIRGKLGDELQELELRSVLASPLCKDGRLLALLLICETRPKQWNEEAIFLIEEVIERLYSYVERIRSEESSKQTNERYRLAIRATNDVVWDWNLESGELAWSDSITELSGYDLSEIEPTADWWFNLVVPEDLPRIKESVMKRMEDGGDFWASDYRMRRKDGTLADVYDRGYLIKNEQGKPIRMIGAIQDLRERVEAKRQLEESALKLQLSLDAASMGTWEYDMETQQVLLDTRSQELLALEHRDRVSFEEFKARFHEEDFAKLGIKSLQYGTSSVHRLQAEVRLEGEYDGSDTWLELHGSSYFDKRKVFSRMLGTLKDISQQKNFELSLKKAKHEVEVASKAKDNFLAALSHELRTPLTPVLMTISSMKSELSDYQEFAKQLEMVERNIELEARLIDDLLDLTKITEAKLVLRLQPCDLHALILFATEIVKEELYAKKQRLAINLKASLSGMDADTTRIQQVFWNLLRNAVKFSPPNSEIVVTTYNDLDGNWHGEISDHGVGVDPEALKSIFEPFEQAGKQNDHRFGGLGLGLAIAKGVVEMHQGTIEANSKGAGLGAVFRVTFPNVYLRPSSESVVPQLLGNRHELKISKQAEERSGPTRVLVVDDHEPTLNVIERLLRRRGYEVRTSSTVSGALRIAEAMNFDLVLSDIGLPDGNGADLMRQLHDAYGLIGIALSGYGMDKDICRGLDSGFAKYLTKPINATQLLHAVDELARTQAAVLST